MQTTIVRYKVKADRAGENVALVKNVFKTLEAESPVGLHYVSFQLEDGRSFLHIAVLDDGVSVNPLPRNAAFKKFAAEIKDRCVEPPVAESGDIVGNYRMIV